MYAGTNNAGVKGKEGREILRPFQSLVGPILTVIAYECLNPMEKHGVVATGSIIYEFSPKWELMIRSGIDLSFDTREMIRPYGLKNFPKDITSNKMYSATKTIRTFYLPTGTN